MNMLTAEYNYEKDMAVQRQEAAELATRNVIQKVEMAANKAATQKEMEIAKKMLDKGLQINDVFLYTGIPMDRIIEIQKSIKKR